MWDLNFDNENAFANEDAVQYLTSTINAATGHDAMVADTILGSRDVTGSPAQFEIQYICSIPRKKDTGSLIISIVISNIVLLSVFWNIFNWVSLKYLKRSDPNWNVCSGCLDHDHNRPGLMSQTSARIMKMDQDPLCQNVDLEQETLYNNYPGQDLKDWQRLDMVSSASTKSSQRTLHTREASYLAGNPTLKEYVPKSGPLTRLRAMVGGR